MLIGMTAKAKVAVSLPPELVAQARHAVAEGRAPTVSAYVAAALEEKAKLDDLATLLSEMLAVSGGVVRPRARPCRRHHGSGRPSPDRPEPQDHRLAKPDTRHNGGRGGT
jgi:Arc/MetJ-type ribon-helix-helix transcriptional regulator